MKIPLIDLQRQYAAIGAELDAAWREVMESGQFILGPQVKAFEGEMATYCGTAEAVGVASGTDALRLALEAVGVGAGDEVIIPPFTFVATAEMVSQLGAVPIFADIDPVTYNIDPDQVATRISSRTRAIIPVHIYGQTVEMDPLMDLARRHGIWVIEDAAQAIGAEYHGRRAGSLGHLACFSFFPTKNLGGCGDGGLVTTSDPALGERLRLLRAHGSREKYVHESLGWSSRLDEIQAAVLRVKLRHLDAWTAARRDLAARYSEELGGLPIGLPIERAGHRAVYHLYTVRTAQREALRKHLAEQGIASAVHYPVPLHRQPIYRHLGVDLPESERASAEVLSLPLFPELEAHEQKIVTSTIAAFVAGLERS